MEKVKGSEYFPNALYISSTTEIYFSAEYISLWFSGGLQRSVGPGCEVRCVASWCASVNAREVLRAEGVSVTRVLLTQSIWPKY